MLTEKKCPHGGECLTFITLQYFFLCYIFHWASSPCYLMEYNLSYKRNYNMISRQHLKSRWGYKIDNTKQSRIHQAARSSQCVHSHIFNLPLHVSQLPPCSILRAEVGLNEHPDHESVFCIWMHFTCSAYILLYIFTSVDGDCFFIFLPPLKFTYIKILT